MLSGTFGGKPKPELIEDDDSMDHLDVYAAERSNSVTSDKLMQHRSASVTSLSRMEQRMQE